jgi:ABC-2 type transport system ATP-binding protein
MTDNKNNLICLKGIYKKFSYNTVLQDINLKVSDGEIFGLLGPSGAGKTTLIKIITGQLKASEGEACIFNVSSDKLTHNELIQIGIVMDNCGIYSRLSCFDNLKLFAKIFKKDDSDIYEALDSVGLGGAIKKSAGKLSKGMVQRLVLARAILHAPKILFLDEPTSGLDPVTANDIRNLLFEINRKGTTIFLTTHNMHEASEMCEHIALLNDGKIVEYGNPKEICLKYTNELNIKCTLRNGETFEIGNESSLTKLLDYYRKNEIVSIHTNEPDLDDVFLMIAGRRLENNECV